MTDPTTTQTQQQSAAAPEAPDQDTLAVLFASAPIKQQTALASPFLQTLTKVAYAGRKGWQRLVHQGFGKEDFDDDPAAAVLFDVLLSYFAKHKSGEVSPGVLLAGWGVELLAEPSESLDFWFDTLRTVLAQRIMQTRLPDIQEAISKGEVSDALSLLADVRDNVRQRQQEQLRPRPLSDVIPDVVSRYEFVKAGNVGVPYPWPTITQATKGAWPEELILFVARTGVGKCLDARTIMYDPESGKPMEATGMLGRRQQRLTAWSLDKGIHETGVAARHNSGIRSVLQISTHAGRTLRVTPEHMILTPEGWTRADALLPREGAPYKTVAVPRFSPTPRKAVAYREDQCALLAYVVQSVADSPLSPGNLVHWVQTHHAGKLVLSNMLYGERDKDGALYLPTAKSETAAAVLSAAVQSMCGVGFKWRDTIPTAVYTMSHESLAMFLGYLWSLAGSVFAPADRLEKAGHGYAQLRLRSVAQIEGVQHLLTRLGIHTLRRDTGNGLARHTLAVLPGSWAVFTQTLGGYLTPAQRESAERLAAHAHEDTTDRPSTSPVIDGALRDAHKLVGATVEIDRLFGGRRPTTVRDYYAGKGTKTHLRRTLLDKLVRALTSLRESSPPTTWSEIDACLDVLRPVCDPSVAWDRVVSVTPVETPVHCVDFTTPDTHCFVAGDVVVHNSWALILWAVCAARENKRVLLATTELAQESIAARGAAVDLALPYENLRAGALSKAEEARLYAAAAQEFDSNIFIFGGDFEQNLESLEGAIDDCKPDLVLVDGIYLFKSAALRKSKNNNRTDRVTENFNYVKTLAKQTRLPFGVSTQLNREAAKPKANGGGAGLHNISLSDAAGWNADVVLALEQSMDQYRDGEVEVVPLKVREAKRPPSLLVNWKLDIMDFTEMRQQGVGQAAEVVTHIEDGTGAHATPTTDPLDPIEADPIPF